MIFKLEKYNGTHRIVSLAFDQDAYDNLLKKDLDFIYVDDNSLKLYPEDVIISTDEKIIKSSQHITMMFLNYGKMGN